MRKDSEYSNEPIKFIRGGQSSMSNIENSQIFDIRISKETETFQTPKSKDKKHSASVMNFKDPSASYTDNKGQRGRH